MWLVAALRADLEHFHHCGGSSWAMRFQSLKEEGCYGVDMFSTPSQRVLQLITVLQPLPTRDTHAHLYQLPERVALISVFGATCLHSQAGCHCPAVR
jgi:hypothetical protein